MTIKQYKIRDINKKPELHKEVFVTLNDFYAVSEMLVNAALEAGADKDKLDEFFNGDKNESH